MDRKHLIKIREAGSGYGKGDVIGATFHGCAVMSKDNWTGSEADKGEMMEFALLTLDGGPLGGKKMCMPFRVFRFVDNKEASNENQA